MADSHDTAHDQNRPTDDVEYREIPGFTAYLAGSDGTVFSCLREVRSGKKWVRGDSWRRLKGCSGHGGYPNVCVKSDEGKQVTLPVHRLILLAFRGPLQIGMVTRHLNGVPTDNRLSNLCYGTYADNAVDRDEHGTTCRGENSHKSKLTADQVKEIRRLRKSGISSPLIGRMFSVSRSTIRRAVNGESWSSVA
jgi:hypothetical protein